VGRACFFFYCQCGFFCTNVHGVERMLIIISHFHWTEVRLPNQIEHFSLNKWVSVICLLVGMIVSSSCFGSLEVRGERNPVAYHHTCDQSSSCAASILFICLTRLINWESTQHACKWGEPEADMLEQIGHCGIGVPSVFCTTFFSSTNGIAFSPLIGGSCIYARYHFCEDVKLFLQISLDDATKYHVYTVRLQ